MHACNIWIILKNLHCLSEIQITLSSCILSSNLIHTSTPGTFPASLTYPFSFAALKIICFLLPCLTMHFFRLLFRYRLVLQVSGHPEVLFFMRRALPSRFPACSFRLRSSCHCRRHGPGCTFPVSCCRSGHRRAAWGSEGPRSSGWSSR